jgi:hypothetical protein
MLDAEAKPIVANDRNDRAPAREARREPKSDAYRYSVLL